MNVRPPKSPHRAPAELNEVCFLKICGDIPTANDCFRFYQIYSQQTELPKHLKQRKKTKNHFFQRKNQKKI